MLRRKGQAMLSLPSAGEDEGQKAPETARKAPHAPKTNKKKGDAGEKRRRLRSIAFSLIVLILMLIISAMIASQFFDNALLEMPRKLIARVMAPIQTTFSSGTGWFYEYIQRLKRRGNIEYEYEQLYNKYDEMLSQVMLVEELQQQLSEYADLSQELQQHTHFDGVAAMVIDKSSDNYFSTFTINVGTNQGVKNSMAVVKSGGLVGYTYNVTETTAQVKGIIDSDAQIAALIESSRDQGIVSGTLGIDGQAMCRMYYLSEDHLPRQGDTVVTSGVGMEFPKGIPIGTVRESTRGMDAGKSYIVLEPIVDFEHIEYVIVYRYQPTYAESADTREEGAQQGFASLPTARPVPTFGVSAVEGFNVGQTETPAPDAAAATAPAQSAAPAQTSDPAAAPVSGATDAPQGNLTYEVVTPTPTLEPTPSPTPSPVPTPTFSINNLTIEEE